jgi:hypothetical protein
MGVALEPPVVPRPSSPRPFEPQHWTALLAIAHVWLNPAETRDAPLNALRLTARDGLPEAPICWLAFDPQHQTAPELVTAQACA